jgi:hypothetical protein
MIWIVALFIFLLAMIGVLWVANSGLREAAKTSEKRLDQLNSELENRLDHLGTEKAIVDEFLRTTRETVRLRNNEIESLKSCDNFNQNEPMPPWDSNDVSVLAGFLKSQTGQRLLGTLSALREQYVRESLHSKTKGEFASGRASGWSVCVTYIRRSAITSAPSEPQSDEQESGQPQPMMGRHVLTTLGESSK